MGNNRISLLQTYFVSSNQSMKLGVKQPSSWGGGGGSGGGISISPSELSSATLWFNETNMRMNGNYVYASNSIDVITNQPQSAYTSPDEWRSSTDLIANPQYGYYNSETNEYFYSSSLQYGFTYRRNDATYFDDWFENDVENTDGYSIFFVLNIHPSSNGQDFFGLNGSSNVDMGAQLNGNILKYYVVVSNTPYTVINNYTFDTASYFGNYHIYSFTYNHQLQEGYFYVDGELMVTGSLRRPTLYVNGSASSSLAYALDFPANFNILATGNSSFTKGSGSFKEFALFNNVVTGSDLQGLVTYWKNKHGIA